MKSIVFVVALGAFVGCGESGPSAGADADVGAADAGGEPDAGVGEGAEVAEEPPAPCDAPVFASDVAWSGEWIVAPPLVTPELLPMPGTGRVGHSTVWTGAQVVVWGGDKIYSPTSSTIGSPMGDGARFDPETGEWKRLSDDGAPGERVGHAGVWTGERMLVWGGHTHGGGLSSGGAWDPATDTWAAMSEDDAPAPRTEGVAVWSGTELIVQGGLVELNDGGGKTIEASGEGGRYDPATDSWRALNDDGAPAGLRSAQAVWTGDELVVWGGIWFGPTEDGLSGGARYSPEDDAWTPMESSPFDFANQAAVWTGSEMLVWSSAGGGAYDPVCDRWRVLPLEGAPDLGSPSAMLAGDSVLVWWRADPESAFAPFVPGPEATKLGRFDLAANAWVDEPPPPAGFLDAVWTGTEAITLTWMDKQ